MIPTSNIVAFAITLTLSTVLPFVLWGLCGKKTEGTLRYVIIGTLAYIVAELLFRIPTIKALASIGAFDWLMAHPLPYALVMSLTGALVEALARWFALKKAMQEHISYDGALAFGIGFGGIEAIALVGYTYVSYLTVALLINQGLSENIDQLAETLQVLAEPHWFTFLLTGIERVFVIFLQIALCVCLSYAMQKNQTKKGFWLCAAAQFFYSFVAQLLSQTVDAVYADAFLLLCTVGAFVLMKRLKGRFTLQEIYKNPNFR